MIMTILILSILSVVLAITCCASIRLLIIAQNKIDIYETWVLEFRDDINNVYNRIKFIDDKQMFEKDDEVGVVFDELYEVIKKLNDRTQSNDENQENYQETDS